MTEAVSLLPPENATPWETAQELTDAESWLALDTGSITRVTDPLLTPADKLSLLAWGRSVDLYYPDWSEEKRRTVVDQWFAYERLKGKEAGFRRFFALVEGTLERVIAPPQHFYMVDDWTPAERDAYLAQLDEIRIHRSYPAGIEADGLFADVGFWADAFYNSEPSYHGYRKQAFLVRPDGIQVELSVSWQLQVSADGIGTEIERITLPAKPDCGFYGSVDFWDEDFLDGGDPIGERTIETTSEAPTRTTYGRQQFGIVFPRGQRVTAEPQLIFEIGPPDVAGTFADADFWDETFWMPDGGWEQVYERYYLANPDAAVGPAEAQGCYWDDALYGIAPHTAEMTVAQAGTQAEYGAEEWWGVGFYLPPELERFERLIDAAEAAKTATDTILINTATHRWPRFGDRFRLDGALTFGEMIKDR